METANDSQTDMYLNYCNINTPNVIYVSNPISPSLSAQSENSLESTHQHHPYHQQLDHCSSGEEDDDEDVATVAVDIEDDDDSTQELTNLTWLTQLKNLVAWPHSVNPILDDEIDNNRSIGGNGVGGGSGGVSGSITPNKKDTLNDRFQRFVGQARQNRETYEKSAELFQVDKTDKPPFNYAQMIAMAMLENGRMTLQHICSWIQNKFGYYRSRNNWNNSIRHNLSLQFCFRKIDRSVYNKGDGKGGFWELGIDANKSERKRIRNRKSSATSRAGTIVGTTVVSNGCKENHRNNINNANINDGSGKRRKYCNYVINQSVDNTHNSIVSDDLDVDPIVITKIVDTATAHNDCQYLFDRTLNSINTSINIDQLTTQTLIPNGDIDIGRVIEVDFSTDYSQQMGQMECHRLQTSSSLAEERIDLNQIAHELYVLSDITNGDYLNISASDLVSSAEDIFDNQNFSGSVETASASTVIDNITTVTTPSGIALVSSLNVEEQCMSNEIFLASEVPQPSENVVISALNSYQMTSGDDVVVNNDDQRNHITVHSAEKCSTTTTTVYTLPADDNQLKSYFGNIDSDFQFLRGYNNTSGTNDTANEDPIIDVLYDISSGTQF